MSDVIRMDTCRVAEDSWEQVRRLATEVDWTTHQGGEKQMKTVLNYIGQVAKAAVAGALGVAGTAVVNQSFDWKAILAGALIGAATFLVPNKKKTS